MVLKIKWQGKDSFPMQAKLYPLRWLLVLLANPMVDRLNNIFLSLFVNSAVKSNMGVRDIAPQKPLR